MTTNELTVKDSFHFAEELFDQQHDLFMGSMDVDSLFTNRLLEETIQICTNELKELLSLATKDSHFNCDETLYKQIHGVAMGPP